MNYSDQHLAEAKRIIDSIDTASLAAEVDLAVIFAEDARKRDFLHDDFAAAGARAIVLAGVDSFGEIIEMAA